MVTILRGATLIDGTGAAPLHNSVILVEGERIARVGPEASFGAQLPAKDEDIIDLSGCFVIPGLINAHEHLDIRRAPGSFQERVAKDSLYLVLRSARNALLDLQEGVTTVRDLHSKDCSALQVRQAIESGIILGCRVFACGLPIAMTGGHADDIAVVANGVAEVRAAARRLLRAGADIVKCMASGGNLYPGRDLPTSQQLTFEELRAAFDEGHRAGKPTTVHAHPSHAVRAAIAAGADCIEHGSLIDEATAEYIAAKDIPLVPTVSGTWLNIQQGEALGKPKWLIESSKVRFTRRMEILAMNVRAGIRLAVGTDGGLMLPEMLLMNEAGLSPLGVIEAATRVGAEILGRQDELGTIEPGKLADMVVLEADPLADLKALARVKWVFKAGRAYDPGVLAAATGRFPA